LKQFGAQLNRRGVQVDYDGHGACVARWRSGSAFAQITTDKLADEPASSKSALTLFSSLDRGHSPYALRMTTFALVHGSWHGAWCWELLSPFLRTPRP